MLRVIVLATVFVFQWQARGDRQRHISKTGPVHSDGKQRGGMSLITLLFLAALALVCGYAFMFGGRTGILGAGIIIAATLLTIAADRVGPLWVGMNFGIVIVDALCWIALLGLALYSAKYWPIWAAGLQMAALLTHLSRILAPDIAAKPYEALTAFWSLPILAIMLLGIRKDVMADNIFRSSERVNQTKQ